MRTKFITIEREYGSGGTKIARTLSEETGIPCYGREILDMVSKTRDIPVGKIESYEESVTNSFLYTIYAMAQASAGSTDMLTEENRVFVDEQEEIQKLARKGRAIFLGHCASEALRDENGVIRVFIRCSDSAKKKKRIMEDYKIPEYDVERTKKKFDKKRSNYYYANTAKKWSDPDNYDIILDSSVLGIDGCVALLKPLLLN